LFITWSHGKDAAPLLFTCELQKSEVRAPVSADSVRTLPLEFQMKLSHNNCATAKRIFFVFFLPNKTAFHIFSESELHG